MGASMGLKVPGEVPGGVPAEVPFTDRFDVAVDIPPRCRQKKRLRASDCRQQIAGLR